MLSATYPRCCAVVVVAVVLPGLSARLRRKAQANLLSARRHEALADLIGGAM